MIALKRYFCALTIFGFFNAFANAAETFPSKSIRLISLFGAGTPQDTNLRVFAARLSDIAGQPVVHEGMPSAAGPVLSGRTVARAPADGHTLLFNAGGQLLTIKTLQPDVGFDESDFVPITKYATSFLALVTRADSDVRNVEGLVAKVKANPGKFNYGSGGVSSPAHFGAAAFQAVTQIDVTHIPYKGVGDFLLGMTRGDVEFSVPAMDSVLALVRSGKLRMLATTGSRRSAAFPDIPTLNEVLGSDVLVQEIWTGIWAPAKTPPGVIRTLHALIGRALADATVKKQYESSSVGRLSPSSSPEEFASFVKQERPKWLQIVKLSGAKVD